MEEIDEIIGPKVDKTALTEEELLEYYKLILPSETPEEIAKALNNEKAFLGEKELVNAIHRYGSFSERLIRMLDSHTHQTELTKEILAELKSTEKVGNSYEHIGDPDNPDDVGFALRNRTLANMKSRKGAEVSGRDAKVLILSDGKNIKRINLYNSGFLVILRCPKLAEINVVYNQLKEGMDEYGRILGAMFYMHSDIIIKSIIWDFIESLVLDSNLIEYDRAKRLRNNVSLADYNTLLLGVLSLMYKNGYPFVHMCTDEKCKHQVEEDIDLSLLQLTDFSRIPHDQLRFLATASRVDSDKLIDYRNSLKLDDAITVGNYRIHRRVPSIGSYLDSGNEFFEELKMSVHELKNEELLQEFLNFSYIHIYDSWIAYAEVLADTGEASFKVVERDSVELILTQIQDSEDAKEFATNMNEYAKSVCITTFGYAYGTCPECGREPSNKINGFIPFDVTKSFFHMAVLKLLEKH